MASDPKLISIAIGLLKMNDRIMSLVLEIRSENKIQRIGEITEEYNKILNDVISQMEGAIHGD